MNTIDKKLGMKGDIHSILDRLADLIDTAMTADGGAFVDVEIACDEMRRALGQLRLFADKTDTQLTELATQVAEMRSLATRDPLTGIFNRRGFEYELNRTMATHRRSGEHGVLVMVDLDGFKLVNDTYGHAAGDEVLCRVAQILQDNIRESDVVARMGGDEFAVLLAGASRSQGLVRAEELNRQLNNAFAQWNGRMLALSASLGFQAFGPNDTANKVLQRADAAMYRIKKIKCPKDGGRPPKIDSESATVEDLRAD